MKTFSSWLLGSVCILLCPFFSPAQNPGFFTAVDDSICIMQGQPFYLNVLDNDLPPGSNFQIISVQATDSCFTINQNTGELIFLTPNDEDCCGTHFLRYTICDNPDFDCMAEVEVIVKCAKPDCFLVNLDEAGGGTPAGQGQCLSACENSTATYFTAYNPVDSYTWTVTGGTFVTGANPAQIHVTWGAAGSGLISLSVNNGPPEQFCVDILVSPVANFTKSDATPCLGSPVYFTNTSVGATGFFWDFGDGATSTMPDPTHTYSTPGTYTVCLYVMSTNYDEGGHPLCCCADSLCMDIVVDPLPGPNIYCVSTLCAFDSTKYWTDANCSSYTWTATNADGSPAPITGQGTDTICVQWGAGPFGTVTLQVSGCTPALCPDPVSVVVPIISDTIAIGGPVTVCAGATATYTAPKWISAWYDWDVTGGTIVGSDSMHTVTIQWGPGPTGTIHLDWGSDFLGGLPGHDQEDCQGDADLVVDIKPQFNVFGPSVPICVGSTSFISATGFPWGNYTWTITPAHPITSGQGTGSITVDWNAPGSYVVTAVPTNLTFYCNNSASTVVQVVELLPPDSITGPLEICPDDVATYFGHTSQPGVSYVWTVTGGTPGSFTGNPITVDWNPTGPYILSLQLTQLGPPFCTSDPLQVTVTPKILNGPVTITGSGACVNKTENYTATTGLPIYADAVYTWSIVTPNLGSVVGGQGTPNATIQWNNIGGVAAVMVTVQLCNQTLSATLPVVIGDPMVTITQNGLLCPGQTATLMASGGFGSYVWSPSGSGQTIPLTAAGTYIVTATNAAGCTAVESFTATAAPGPTASISTSDPTVLCIVPPNSNTVLIQALTNPNYQYNWLCNGSPPVPPNTQDFLTHMNSNVPGTFAYQVIVTDVTTGCTNISNTIVVNQIICPDDTMPPCIPVQYSITITSSLATSKCDVINFMVAQTGGPVTLTGWNFGDGSGAFTGTLDNATHTYPAPGNYLATVFGTVPEAPPGMGVCTVAQSIPVKVQMVAKFGFTVGCALKVNFNEMCVFLPGAGPTSFSWDFGDGNTGTGSSPMHTYLNPGTYTVMLTATSAAGCQSMATLTVVVPPPPNASFTAVPNPVCVGDPVTFTGLGSGILTWTWNFGDGSFNGAQMPQHAYTFAPMTHTVILTVEDAQGCTSTSSQNVAVVSLPASGSITASGPLIFCTGDNVVLTAPAGFSYAWSPSGNIQSITVTTSGTYSVVLTNADGCTRELDSVVVVVLPAPLATISGNPVICDQGCTTLSAPAGLTYQWLDNALNPIAGEVFQNITVCTPGLLPGYAVSVTDANGCTAISAVVVVSVAVSPAFTLSIAPTPACAGTPTTITLAPVQTNVVYTWSNGGSGPSITVLQAGTYTVVGTDTTTGCTASASETVHPLPDLCIVPVGCYKACDPDTICGPDGLSAYQWNLNGVPIPGATNQCLVVTQSGTYTLTGVNSFGCSATSDSLILMLIDCSCESLEVTAEPSETDSCCWTLTYDNPSFNNLYGVTIYTNDAQFQIDLSTLDPALQVTSILANSISLTNSSGSPLPDPMPAGVLADFLTICLTDVQNFPQQIIFDWYDYDYEVVCSDTLLFDCPVEPDCMYATEDSIYCDSTGAVVYTVTLCNPVDNDFTVGWITLNTSPANVVVTPAAFPVVPPMAPGECRDFTFTITGHLPGDTLCYGITAHDMQPSDPDTSLCCMLDTTYCVPIPDCDPCDDVGVEFVDMVSADPGPACCAFIGLYNNFAANYFDGIDLCMISQNTTMTINNPFGSGWATSSYSPSMISLDVIPPLGTSIPLGVVQLPMLCFQADEPPPQFLEIKWMQGDSIECRDTVELFCEPPCGYISDDSIFCDANGNWSFFGILHNTSQFTMGEAHVVFTSPPGLGSQTFNLGGLFPGGTIPITFVLGPPAQPGDTVCFTVALHEIGPDSLHINCCNFYDCIVLPDCTEPVTCLCDDEFEALRDEGMSYVVQPLPANTATFAPYGKLGDCDRVVWTWSGGAPPDTTYGNSPITHTFPFTGEHQACMTVHRFDPSGIECKFVICRRVRFLPTILLPDTRITLLPNPSGGRFYVKMDPPPPGQVVLQVYDVYGRAVTLPLTHDSPGAQPIPVELGAIAGGVYLIEIRSEGKRWIRKVVVE